MPKVFFIDEQDLKKNTPINDNVDTGELRSAIATAQDINLQESLGTELYNALSTKVQAYVDSGTTIHADYKTLLDDYVQPMLIHYSYVYSLDSFIMKFMNAGLMQNNTEQGSSIDINTYKMLRANAKNTAEFYDSRLRDYLYHEQRKFAEYRNITNNSDIPASPTDGFGSSILIDDRYNHKYKYDPDCCFDRYKRL